MVLQTGRFRRIWSDASSNLWKTLRKSFCYPFEIHFEVKLGNVWGDTDICLKSFFVMALLKDFLHVFM